MSFDATPDSPQVFTTQWSGVSSVLEEPLWPRSLRDRLAEFSRFVKNWDSYGSDPIHPEIVEFAADLLSDFAKLAMPAPEIFPVSGGGIQFEWQRSGFELEVEIRPTKDVDFLIVDPEGKMREGQIPHYNVFELAKLRDWFLGHRG